MSKYKISVGLIGGYGLEKMITGKRWIKVKTKYGLSSSPVAVGKIGDKKVALICRHGLKHTIPPHRLNHRANITAFLNLGVKFIITINAVGIINPKIVPGSFILPDDFIDLRFQAVTFFNRIKNGLGHTDMSSGYSGYLKDRIKKAAKQLKIKIRDGGVYINTVGPRFETPAEIRAFSKIGGDIVGMTNAPEVILANEAGIQITTIAIGTNWAAGISKKHLVAEEVDKAMKDKQKHLEKLIRQTIKMI